MRSSAKSQALFDKALRWIPGGVNSPVRAFKGVGGTPVFFHSASGAYLYRLEMPATGLSETKTMTLVR